jgi:hypothetical protein
MLRASVASQRAFSLQILTQVILRAYSGYYEVLLKYFFQFDWILILARRSACKVICTGTCVRYYSMTRFKPWLYLLLIAVYVHPLVLPPLPLPLTCDLLSWFIFACFLFILFIYFPQTHAHTHSGSDWIHA